MKIFKKIAVIALALIASVAALTSCDNNKEALEEAAKKLLITQDKQVVSGDFELTSVLKVDGVTYTITWAADKDIVTVGEKVGNFYQVDVDYLNNNEADELVKLTATISDGKNTVEKVFEFTVPKFDVYTIDEYDAAQSKEEVTVKGVIVAKEAYSEGYKNTAVYLEDASGKGGVYAYRLSCTQEQYDNELVVGNVIFVSGKKYMYNGLREFDGGCTYILAGETATPKVTDITDLIKAGTGISADLQNQLVKFTNLPVVKVEEKDDKGRYNIIVGDATDTTKQFLVRVNTYITPVEGDAYKAYAELGVAPGMIISVSGVCGWYNVAQMHPIDADDIVAIIDDNGKAAYELGAAVFESNYDAGDVTLPVVGKYTDVELAYEVTSGADNASIADGKLTLVASAEDTTVVIKVTATLGDVVLTKDVEIVVNGTEVKDIVYSSIAEAIEIGSAQESNTYTEDKYYIQAIVKEIKNTTYGNMVITDGTNEILIYGTYSADGEVRYDALEVKPEAGDLVLVWGQLGNYNGTPQMKNGWILEHAPVTSIADAITTGSAQESNTYTEDKYYLYGEIKEIKNTTYGNMVITDGTNEILIYGTYSADGEVRYDALEVKPEAGDLVLVWGQLGNYNGTPQMKNGNIVYFAQAAEEDSETTETPADTVLKENTAYTISANNANGLLYFSGTVTSGRFDGTLEASEAVSVYVEISGSDYYIYFMDGETKTYIVMSDKAAGGSFTTDKASATVFEWNATINTLVVAEDSNNRAFGAGASATNNNFSCYDTSNTYNWGQFNEVAA